MSNYQTVDENARPVASGWAFGGVVFAATMMIIVGLFQAFQGLAAILNDEFYVVGEKYIFQFDTTTWGWIHLVVGIVVLAAGVGLFSGAVWVRVVAVPMATVAMLIAFAWLPWYPVWALLFIAVSVAVIWALTAHGRDAATM